ncbi:MAG: hypothetical protein ACO3EZ_01155 [Prochlorotrichaceae cyanobacterium]
MLLQCGQLLETVPALETLRSLLPKPVSYPVCQITYNRDSWVRLNNLLHEYSFDEALLLCESDAGWLAWVPDHGEVLLHRDDFYVFNG